MAGNTVSLVFAGDSQSLERTFTKVGAGAKTMASDFDKAGGTAKRFGSTVDDMNDKVGNSEGKFMATADLLDGLGGAFGLPLEGATAMARSFADLAGGLSGIVGPAIAKVAGMLGIQTAATTAQAGATGAATTAQTSLNAALLANPIGLVVIAVAALVGAFVLAWKNSETFRDIVRGAFKAVRGAAEDVWDFIKSLPEKIGSIGHKLYDMLTWPYRTAFNFIARAWNSTLGGLQVDIPDIPGLPGRGTKFGFPKLKEFHSGGIVPGPAGAEVPILAMAGEQVIPAGAAAGGTTVIQLVVDGRVLTEVVHNGLLAKQRRTPLGLAS